MHSYGRLTSSEECRLWVMCVCVCAMRVGLDHGLSLYAIPNSQADRRTSVFTNVFWVSGSISQPELLPCMHMTTQHIPRSRVHADMLGLGLTMTGQGSGWLCRVCVTVSIRPHAPLLGYGAREPGQSARSPRLSSTVPLFVGTWRSLRQANSTRLVAHRWLQ